MEHRTDPVEYFVTKLVFAFITALIIMYVFKPVLVASMGYLNTAGFDHVTAAFVSIIFPIATTMVVIYKFLGIFIND